MWLAAGFCGYLWHETRHLRVMAQQYPTAGLRFFPPLGRGLALAWLGPGLYLIGRYAQPPARTPGVPSAAARSRERPEVRMDDDEDGPELTVAQ